MASGSRTFARRRIKKMVQVVDTRKEDKVVRVRELEAGDGFVLSDNAAVHFIVVSNACGAVEVVDDYDRVLVVDLECCELGLVDGGTAVHPIDIVATIKE
jgi:hypothetical protein